MNIEISNNEFDLIMELLEQELKTLPVEIHHTKSFDYKDYLREKEILVGILHKRFESELVHK